MKKLLTIVLVVFSMVLMFGSVQTVQAAIPGDPGTPSGQMGEVQIKMTPSKKIVKAGETITVTIVIKNISTKYQSSPLVDFGYVGKAKIVSASGQYGYMMGNYLANGQYVDEAIGWNSIYLSPKQSMTFKVKIKATRAGVLVLKSETYSWKSSHDKLFWKKGYAQSIIVVLPSKKK